MSTVYRANRKATDADIIRLNSVGLSLATIARALDCHPTTVTVRLRQLKIPPADTRRSFMEDVFLSLHTDEQEWLADQLGAGVSIKDFVKQTLREKHRASLNQGSKSEPTEQHEEVVRAGSASPDAT